MELTIAFILSAFIAGLLTFLAPCTLPLVPAYLGFISGVNQDKLKQSDTASGARRKIILNGIFFVLGFSVIFILFGVLAGLVGQTVLAPYRIWLGRIGGGVVILFGLYMLGVFNLPIFSGSGLPLPSWVTPGNAASSFAVGGAFAFGWTPCVGPVLASILFLAGTSGTAAQGGILLAIFSLGLAIPFLALALGFSRATGVIDKISKYIDWVYYIGGAFLIILGVLLLTGNFGLLIQYGFELFDFIDYDSIYQYL